jgi:hypothetical protein
MSDKLTFDLSSEVEGSPMVFIRKDWINILDNQTQNYTSNQSVIDTSQLANSNKYFCYREGMFIVPMTLTMASLDAQVVNANLELPAQPAGYAQAQLFQPLQSGSNFDSALGLKNWFGNIVHSFTLDYNGSTIIQQTPFINMWNSFKLMTSLSYGDIKTQGCTIGFYPDDAEAMSFYDPNQAGSTLKTPIAPTPDALPYAYPGTGTCMNSNKDNSNFVNLSTVFTNYKSDLGNKGFIERQKWINFDVDGVLGQGNSLNTDTSLFNSYSPSEVGAPLSALVTIQNVKDMWKSYVVKKQNQIESAPGTQSTAGVLQYAIIATIYLKHLHSFFNMVPLLKGVFMKMTMNLNNSACTVLAGYNTDAAGAADTAVSSTYLACTQTFSALSGCSLPLIASNYLGNGGQNLTISRKVTALGAGASVWARGYRLSLSVGASCLDSVTNSLPNASNAVNGNNPCKSIYLYIPAYTFNPVFEQAYISSPVKNIKFTDVYQYQVLSVGNTGSGGGQFNNLLTNGIANIKSVLILPFYSPNGDTAIADLDGLPAGVQLGTNTGIALGSPVYQSPFDTAGCGSTSPLCHFTNFNVQVSGQNAIYNLQLRTFEQFNLQLYGQNAVNGGLTDGITSSLIDKQQFDLGYCYYYVNVERMLPVEQSVPKSIQIVGTSMSARKVDLYCFVEYGTEVNIDVLTGSRV